MIGCQASWRKASQPGCSQHHDIAVLVVSSALQSSEHFGIRLAAILIAQRNGHRRHAEQGVTLMCRNSCSSCSPFWHLPCKRACRKAVWLAVQAHLCCLLIGTCSSYSLFVHMLQVFTVNISNSHYRCAFAHLPPSHSALMLAVISAARLFSYSAPQ